MSNWKKRAILGATLVLTLLAVDQAAVQPVATAVGCSWTGTPLPLPSGFSNVDVRGARDASLIVGTAHNHQGVIWRNGQPKIMLRMRGHSGEDFENAPTDINAGGMVSGEKITWTASTVIIRPYSYQTFYTYLPSPDVQRVRTVAMNDRGDITGYSDDLNGHQNVLLWKAGSSTYQTLGAGMPVGIDEDGRVAITGGVIVNPDGTRRALQLPSDVGRVTLSSFEHGMIAGYGFTSSGWSGIVWDATGALVSNVSGAFARSANSHGTMLGQNGTSSADVAVWRGGVLSEYVTNPQPSFSISGSVNSGYGTITDDDVIISDDVNGAPTRWHCQ